MRIVVTSDSHRMRGTLFEIVEKHMQDTDLFINLGDGEDDVDQLTMLYPDLPLKRVAGNCDWGSSLPLYQCMEAGGKRIFFSHGHPFRVKMGYEEIIKEAIAQKADICLFGHTHTQYTNYLDGLYIMNPGAVMNGRYGIIDITKSGIMLIPAQI